MVLPAKLLFVSILGLALLPVVIPQSCSATSRYTQPNLILKDQASKRILGVDSWELCIAKCKDDVNCHSINYYDTTSICEVNKANHLSSPESLVPSSDEGTYRNYHERPTDTCSEKICSYKYLCLPDSSKDDLYKCCHPAEIALHFPRVSTSDYVVFERPFVQDLTALTISLWVKMRNTSISHPKHSHTLFSYAIKHDTDNELTIEVLTDSVNLAVDGKGGYESLVANYLDDKWHHSCLTWDASFQNFAFYADSNLVLQNSSTSSSLVNAGGAVVIGQDQDDYIAGFQKLESLVGYITKVNMWDRAMTSSEVKDLYNACAIVQEGNVIQWSDLYMQKKYGNVGMVYVNSCG